MIPIKMMILNLGKPKSNEHFNQSFHKFKNIDSFLRNLQNFLKNFLEIVSTPTKNRKKLAFVFSKNSSVTEGAFLENAGVKFHKN